MRGDFLNKDWSNMVDQRRTLVWLNNDLLVSKTVRKIEFIDLVVIIHIKEPSTKIKSGCTGSNKNP